MVGSAQVLAEEEHHLSTLCNLGALEEDAGDEQTAAVYYARALEVDPDCVKALSNLARIHYAHGRAAEAIELYEKAVAQPEVCAACCSVVHDSQSFMLHRACCRCKKSRTTTMPCSYRRS